MNTTNTDNLQPIGHLISLKGRTAIVTGAAQGIGLAIAQRLVESGATVFLGDVNVAAAESAAAKLSSEFGGRALGGFLDVGDPEVVSRVVAEVRAKCGSIDVLVNNAGIYPPVMLPNLDLEAWQRVIRINLDGVLLCSREVAAVMDKDSRGGVIVNITSTGASRAQTSGMAAYVASKHGVDGLTKSLAIELGSRGIRVMSVAPTLIATPGIHALSAGADVRELAARIHSTIPLQRIGTADEVARVVLFCASDLAAFVSGSTIYVDGGSMAV